MKEEKKIEATYKARHIQKPSVLTCRSRFPNIKNSLKHYTYDWHTSPAFTVITWGVNPIPADPAKCFTVKDENYKTINRFIISSGNSATNYVTRGNSMQLSKLRKLQGRERN